MKKKELNTFIQDKLDTENGIPFKDEYWNQMNELLDENLPASNVSSKEKGSSSILKLIYLSVTCLLLITISILSYSYFTSDTTQVASLKSKTKNENDTRSTSQILVQNEREKELVNPLTIAPKTIPGESTFKVKQTTNKLATTIATTNVINTVNNINNSNNIKAEPIKNENDFTYNETSFSKEEFPMENLPLNKHKEEFLNSQTEFNFIDSKLPTFVLETPAIVLQPTMLLPNPNRNSLVKHLNISVFMGAIHQAQGNTIQSYTLPTQTNFTYGISFESTIKRISFKTGLAMSSCHINLNSQYQNNVYTVDTTYKIINPNYGTTLSGKPVTLVQKHLDTTSVNTTTYNKESSYTYQILSIPTTLQYKIPLNRFILILEGGALHHIRVGQQSIAPIQVNNSETPAAFPSYSMQVCAGGGLRYSLNLNWAIGVNYKYSLNPNKLNLNLVNNTQQAMFAITRYLW